MDREFSVDGFDVVLNGAQGDRQLGADFTVGQSTRDEFESVDLALRERRRSRARILH
jgi:hypothetical protein